MPLPHKRFNLSNSFASSNFLTDGTENVMYVNVRSRFAKLGEGGKGKRKGKKKIIKIKNKKRKKGNPDRRRWRGLFAFKRRKKLVHCLPVNPRRYIETARDNHAIALMHDAFETKTCSPIFIVLTSQVHVMPCKKSTKRKTGCIALVIAKHFLKQILLQGRELKHTQSTCLV